MEFAETRQTSKTYNTSTLAFVTVLSVLIVGYSARDSSAEDLITSLDELEPSINIESYENRTTEEYSINNNVYMIKVTPKVGAPYYLVDPDGSGDMEWKRETDTKYMAPPRWTLHSW